MKEHRIRKMEAKDNPVTHELVYWVEIEENRWLPCTEMPDHEGIEEFLKKEQSSNKKHIAFASRAFNIGIIRGEWKELETIK